MTEEDLKEFRIWQKTRHQTALEHAFLELEELVVDMKGYNISMPSRSFKVLCNALLLLKKEVIK